MGKETKTSTVSGAYQKVQNLFFDFPTREFSLNDICAAVGIAKTTASIVVNRLVEEGFLKRSVIGKLWRISCNPDHMYNASRKMPYHLVLIRESGLLEDVHKAVPYAKAVILFGSYRKGDDVEKSDIDLAAEVVGEQEHKIIELKPIQRLGHRRDVKVSLHVFSRSRINPNLFANMANGIVLEGFLEVKP